MDYLNPKSGFEINTGDIIKPITWRSTCTPNFPQGISSKCQVITKIEFELVYF